MTLKLKSMERFNEAKQTFLSAVKNGADQEAQGEAYADMINGLAEDVMDEAKKAARAEAESFAIGNPADAKLSAGQRKFFNEVNKEVGYKEEKLLPQETIDRIFEDLTTEHPLLSEIGIKNAGLRLKFLKSETSGTAVWGKIFGEIKGQLDAIFSDEEDIQNKLTAFVVIPKDLQEYGPAWVERFVRLQIQEALSVALELAFLTGDGNDKPVGLDRDIRNGSTSGSSTTYPRKSAQGTLTFADERTTVRELTSVFKHHSTTERVENSDGTVIQESKSLSISGKVVMVVSPADAWDIQAQYTHLNANGVFVTALPFNLKIVESEAQDAGRVTVFVRGRYDAFLGGGIKINKFDQTLALEDLDLYVAKQFAYGMAKDNKAASVWNLNIPENVNSGNDTGSGDNGETPGG